MCMRDTFKSASKGGKSGGVKKNILAKPIKKAASQGPVASAPSPAATLTSSNTTVLSTRTERSEEPAESAGGGASLPPVSSVRVCLVLPWLRGVVTMTTIFTSAIVTISNRYI